MMALYIVLLGVFLAVILLCVLLSVHMAIEVEADKFHLVRFRRAIGDSFFNNFFDLSANFNLVIIVELAIGIS